ncbi:MAG: carbohydrate ABC transporter permease [Oscillospiraceae bacterium]|nr:carbohydrate ABC transporter permease [Oscillospiraceae bacterium]
MNKVKKTSEDWIVDIVTWGILLIILFITLYPFYYILVASFNDGNDLTRGGVYFWPRKFTLDNYMLFFGKQSWINSLWVSIFRTVVGSALTLVFTSLISYGLSRPELIFKKFYRFLFIFSMYVSGGLIPYYVMLRNLHLLNKIWVYVIPTMLNLFFVLVGISFFESIPASLLESARLDGAAEIVIFIRIVLPVSVPFLATLALFAAVGQWNAWLDSAYYVNADHLRTLAYRMMSEINRAAGAASNQNVDTLVTSPTVMTTMATAMCVSMLPIICVYPFLQRYFVQGIMIGSVKE